LAVSKASEQEEIVYMLDDNGYLTDEHGNYILDDNGEQIKLGEQEIAFLRDNN
jgi:flagellar basal body rod protein FlgG